MSLKTYSHAVGSVIKKRVVNIKGMCIIKIMKTVGTLEKFEGSLTLPLDCPLIILGGRL